MNLRPNTRAAYANLLRRYLLPTFNLTPLADLDPLAVRSWLAGMEAAGVGASTRAKCYRLLSRILAQAVEAGYLSQTVRRPVSAACASALSAPRWIRNASVRRDRRNGFDVVLSTEAWAAASQATGCLPDRRCSPPLRRASC